MATTPVSNAHDDMSGAAQLCRDLQRMPGNPFAGLTPAAIQTALEEIMQGADSYGWAPYRLERAPIDPPQAYLVLKLTAVAPDMPTRCHYIGVELLRQTPRLNPVIWAPTRERLLCHKQPEHEALIEK